MILHSLQLYWNGGSKSKQQKSVKSVFALGELILFIMQYIWDLRYNNFQYLSSKSE